MRYIGQQIARQIDIDLMNPAIGGFKLEQLMELAGLSVAQALYAVYPPKSHPDILVCCGTI